jgi:hypothetical protein
VTYSYHEQMKMLGASDSMIAAMDILADAGLLNEERLRGMLAAELLGQDPETCARHLVKTMRAAQNTEPRGQ